MGKRITKPKAAKVALTRKTKTKGGVEANRRLNAFIETQRKQREIDILSLQFREEITMSKNAMDELKERLDQVARQMQDDLMVQNQRLVNAIAPGPGIEELARASSDQRTRVASRQEEWSRQWQLYIANQQRVLTPNYYTYVDARGEFSSTPPPPQPTPKKDEDLQPPVEAGVQHGFEIKEAGKMIVNRAEYDKYKATLKLQNDALNRILKQPVRKMASILALNRNAKLDWVLLLTDGSQPFEADFPMDLYYKLSLLIGDDAARTKFHVGKQVYIDSKTRQVIATCDHKQIGEIYSVVEDKGGICSAERSGVKVFLFKDKTLVLKAGDKVLVNHQKVVFDVIVEPPKTYGSNPGVNWSDIADHYLPKKLIQESIRSSSEVAKRFGKKPLKGILLFGPPGCGKTMLAKAAATELLGTMSGGFIYIKGPEILSRYVGDSESAIRNIFADARAFKKQNNKPCVIFIDEAEAILSKRGEIKGASSFMSGTIVPQFLSEWDGLDESGAVVILATNRANDLDEAIMREGRIDRKIHVPRPDRSATKTITELYLKKTIVDGDILELSDHVALKIFANYPTVKNKVCGALLSNLVDRAISYAVDRSTEEKISAVGKGDLVKAIEEMENEYQAIR